MTDDQFDRLEELNRRFDERLGERLDEFAGIVRALDAAADGMKAAAQQMGTAAREMRTAARDMPTTIRMRP